MHPPAGIEFVTRRARLHLRLRLIAAFAVGVLAVGCGGFVADPGYRATQLPDDVTELFEVQPVVANPDADTVWIFEQGGPAHEISNEVLFAFLRYRGHEDIHLVQAHQTLTLNPRLAARHARLSLANLQAEVDVSVEVLRRVIDHFKAQHKRVVVVGYSYGSFLMARYLALHGPDGADRYPLMAGRLDMPTNFVDGALAGMLYHFPNTVALELSDRRPTTDQESIELRIAWVEMNRRSPIRAICTWCSSATELTGSGAGWEIWATSAVATSSTSVTPQITSRMCARSSTGRVAIVSMNASNAGAAPSARAGCRPDRRAEAVARHWR